MKASRATSPMMPFSMLVRISTILACTAEQLWAEISRPASLRFVSAPLLHFEPLVAGELAVIARAGHLPFAERATAYYDVLSQWLAR